MQATLEILRLCESLLGSSRGVSDSHMPICHGEKEDSHLSGSWVLNLVLGEAAIT